MYSLSNENFHYIQFLHIHTQNSLSLYLLIKLPLKQLYINKVKYELNIVTFYKKHELNHIAAVNKFNVYTKNFKKMYLRNISIDNYHRSLKIGVGNNFLLLLPFLFFSINN